MRPENLCFKRQQNWSYIITQSYVRDSNRAQSKSINHWIIFQNSLKTVTAIKIYGLEQNTSKNMTINFLNANVRTRTMSLAADKNSVKIHAILEYLNQNLNQKQENEHD